MFQFHNALFGRFSGFVFYSNLMFRLGERSNFIIDLCSNGYIIYPNEASPETSTVSADQIVTFDQGESFIDMQPSGTTTTNFYPITLKNGTTYTLAVQTDLLVVQQATKVLLSIL